MSTLRAISAYNFVVGIVLFGILCIAGRLRKDKVNETRMAPFVITLFCQATEKMGSDWIHHGEESYPEAAWLQLEVLTIISISSKSFLGHHRKILKNSLLK